MSDSSDSVSDFVCLCVALFEAIEQEDYSRCEKLIFEELSGVDLNR